MPDSDGLRSAFMQLANAVKGLDEIPIAEFANRLHNKARYNPVNRSLFKYIEFAPEYNPLGECDSHSQYLDADDAAEGLLSRLAMSCVGQATSDVDDHLDTHKIKRCIRVDNAEVRYNEVKCFLMSFCLLEHIDAKLKSLHQPSLQDLFKVPGFREYALETMQNENFIKKEVVVDIWNGNHLFSISMILLSVYFQSDIHSFPAYGHQFSNEITYRILTAWSYNTWTQHTQGDDERTDMMIEFFGKVATIAYTPQSSKRMAQPTPTFDVTKHFYSMIIDSEGRSGDSNYVAALKSSLVRMDGREPVINEWKSHCDALASYFKINLQPKWRNGIIDAFKAKDTNNILDWMSRSQDREENLYHEAPDIRIILDSPWDLSIVNGSVGPILATGTIILLSTGQMCPVEDISDNHSLLAEHEESQEISGSRCIAINAEVSFVSFNGEQPFATPGQVFHTSTGLRAVDPRAAQAANPFQRVGQLAAGHIIYRRNGSKYENVEIKSIEKTSATVQTVYSISPGGRQQNYHANGYLITENDPNQTLHSASESMRKIPERKRIALLRGCEELYSMFLRYDEKTIRERLNLEILNPYAEPDIVKFKSFPAESDKNLATSDGSRPSTRRGKAMQLDRIQRRFELSAHEPTHLPASYHLPELVLIDGCLVADDEVIMRSAHDLHARTFKWTRELQDQQLFEHGILQIFHEGISGHGSVYLTTDSNPMHVSEDGIIPFEAHARSLARGVRYATAAVEDDGFHELETYKLILDKSIWPPDMDKNKPEDPMEIGELKNGFWNPGDGTTVPAIRFPTLDTLRDQINKESGQNLDTLYRTECVTLQDDTFRGTVRFHRASMIPFISNSGEDISKLYDVQFPDLSLTLELPVLFQEFYMDLDIFGGNNVGALYEYDPTKRAMKGNRHFLKAESTDLDALSNLRSKVSRAFATFSQPGVTASSLPSRQPASITDVLIKNVKPTLELLLKFASYEEKSVHTTSQTLISNMMYYHMDQGDREKFTSRSKPDNLPLSLADNLPTKLKDFFHDKYAPAFLCRSISSFEKYSKKFTDTEKKKLWYWWEGNGDKCLSQSQEYNDINNLTSIEAMRILYSKEFDAFFDSAEGPVKWAQKLKAKLEQDAIMNYFLQDPIKHGGNAINRECCVMNTLAPSEDFADEWFTKIVDYAGQIGMDYPYIDEDTKIAGQWLNDSMLDLIIKILLDDPSITAEVKDTLSKDIEAFEKANGLDQTLTAEKRANNILVRQGIFLAEAPKWFTAIGNGLAKAFGGTRLFQWLGQAFDKVSQKIPRKIPGMKYMKGISTLVMAAFYVGMIATNMVGLIKNWAVLKPDQKATVILETLKIATDGVSYAIDKFKSFKDNPTTKAVDHLQAESLNQGTERALRESSQDLRDMSEKINGEGGFHDSVAEHVGTAETPTAVSGEEVWNEKIQDPAKNVPPGGEVTTKQFSISGKILKGLNIALGIGVTIAMTFTLAREWNSLTTPGKIIQTLVVIVQALTVILDVIDLGAAAGLWAVTGTMAVALPIVGAVLAVVGVVLMIIGFFVNMYKSNPPPDPVADYIKKNQPLIAKFNTAPDPKLQYSVSTTRVTPGVVTSITIEAVNNSSKDVEIKNSRITLLSGDDDTCLFAEANKFHLVGDDSSSKNDEDYTYVTPDELVDANLPTPSQLGTTSIYYQYDLRLAGPKKKGESSLQSLVLKPAARVRSVWTGIINKKGSDKDHTSSTIDIVETFTNQDKSHVPFSLVRG